MHTHTYIYIYIFIFILIIFIYLFIYLFVVDLHSIRPWPFQDRLQCLGAEFGAAAELSAPVPRQRLGLGRAMSGGKRRLAERDGKSPEHLGILLFFWVYISYFSIFECWLIVGTSWLLLIFIEMNWYLFVVYLFVHLDWYDCLSLPFVMYLTMTGIIPIIMMNWWIDELMKMKMKWRKRECACFAR